MVGESSGPCAVILGVGINVCMPTLAAEGIEQGWTDLQRLCSADVMPSRNRLAASLLEHLLPAIAEFEKSGLQPFLEEWHRYDVVTGREVDLHLPGGTVSGTACGIDEGGALLVDTPQGRQRFTSCEVSVRIAS